MNNKIYQTGTYERLGPVSVIPGLSSTALAGTLRPRYLIHNADLPRIGFPFTPVIMVSLRVLSIVGIAARLAVLPVAEAQSTTATCSPQYGWVCKFRQSQTFNNMVAFP